MFAFLALSGRPRHRKIRYFWHPGRTFTKKTHTHIGPGGFLAIKKWPVLPPGAFQPSLQVCVRFRSRYVCVFVPFLMAKTTIGKSMCVFVCNPCVCVCVGFWGSFRTYFNGENANCTTRDVRILFICSNFVHFRRVFTIKMTCGHPGPKKKRHTHSHTPFCQSRLARVFTGKIAPHNLGKSIFNGISGD